MTTPTLRVVADESSPTPASVNSPIASDEFDPELDLKGFEDEEDDNRLSAPVTTDKGDAFRRMLRPVGYAFGGLVVLVIAGIMYLQINSSSDTTRIPAPVTAKVDVLEAAMRNAEPASPAPDTNSDATRGVVERAVPTSSDSPSETVSPAPIIPEAPAVALSQPPVPYALLEEMSGTISAIQAITDDIRSDIASHKTQLGRIQNDISLLQTSAIEDRGRVDNLVADFAQLRRTVAEINTAKTRETRALQRQLSLQKKAAKELQAAPKVRPGFQLVSVSQWGEDYLATLSFNGQLPVLGKGDVLDGWTITDIGAHTVAVVRAADGATATLVKGV